MKDFIKQITEIHSDVARMVCWERDILLALIFLCLCYLLFSDWGLGIGCYWVGAAFTYAGFQGWCWGNGSLKILQEPRQYAWRRDGLLEDYIGSVVFSLLWFPFGFFYAVLATEGFRYGFRWAYPRGLWKQAK